MATDLSPISVDQQYAALFSRLNAKLEAMMTLMLTDVTNAPDNTLRLNAQTQRWERWHADTGEWRPAIERYAIDVTTLGGLSPDESHEHGATIVQRTKDGRIKAKAPSAPEDVVRAFEISQHLQASNPHGITAASVGLGELTGAKQLEAAQNLRDLPDAPTARRNLKLGTAALRDIGTRGDQVLTGSDFGAAAFRGVGTGNNDLVARGALGSGAFRDVGTARGDQLATQSDLPTQGVRESALVNVSPGAVNYLFSVGGARQLVSVTVWARCSVSDEGYSPGDDVVVSAYVNGDQDHGASIYVSGGGNVYLLQAQNGIYVINRNNRELRNITPARWSMFVRAVESDD